MLLFREGSADTPDALFTELIPCLLPAPQLMLFPSGSSVPGGFYHHGMAERAVIEWAIENFVSSDKAFVDVGAHVGTYTFTLGKRALHTYAFECSPEAFCYLAANVALHGLVDKVTLFNKALGDREEDVDLYIRSKDGGLNGVIMLTEETPCRKVRMTQLDTLDIRDPIGLIKIDVEGCEREVILGSVQTLRKNSFPPILFESWGPWKEGEAPAAQLRQDLFATLEFLEYEIIEVTGTFDTFLAVYKPNS